MRVDELAAEIGAELVAGGDSQAAEVQRVYAGDRISDVLQPRHRQDATGE
jgi:hypothetical protein